MGVVILCLGSWAVLNDTAGAPLELCGIKLSAPGPLVSLLVLIVVVWTGSYLFRVVTGQMTYMNQRRRYREVYDAKERADLEARFDALPEDEQRALLQRLGLDGDDVRADS